MKKTIFLLLSFLSCVFYAQQTLFSPYEGLMQNPGTVTISNPNSTLYYTTDGTEPTINSSSAINSIQIPISTKTTFKAFYVQNSFTSPVETMTYYVGDFPRPKLFFKPPSTWTSSCAFMQIIEPRTMIDFFEPGPAMNDACEGWKVYPAYFAKGYITFNNCSMVPQYWQATPTFIVSDNFFYDFSAGIITNPPLCLMANQEVTGKITTIKVFPNPVKDLLNFQTDLQFQSYEILDSSGKLFEQKAMSKNQIDVSKLPKGLYYVKLIANQQKKEFFIKFLKD